MKRSIFRRTTRLILILVLLFDIALVVVSYKLAYDRSYSDCVNQLENASGMVDEMLSYYKLDSDTSDEEIEGLENILTNLCDHLDLPYIYIIEVNKSKSTIRYLTIGFGEQATEVAKKDLRPGYVDKLDLPSELLEALDNRGQMTVQHVNNEYGETLIGYRAVRGYHDNMKGEFVVIDEPLVVGVDISLSSVMDELKSNFTIVTILLLVLSVATVLACMLVLYQKISKPARAISRRMSSFVEDYEKEFTELPVKGEDEFAEMSRSFNTMAENIHEYVGNIERLNREKHKHDAEMDIAGKIQLGLLGPARMRTDDFRVDARMYPAKEVGGDLYDHLVLDDGRLFLAIADVSGKGITASLFMSRAVTLLHLYAKLHISPSCILKEYNDTLSQQNPGGLFITTFVAIYDPKTMELTYSNGGHNIPYVVSDTLIPLDEARGVAAGIFPGETYKEAVVKLKPGDRLFLYTDGVNEAVSQSGELYSVERLEKRLMEYREKGVKNYAAQILLDLRSYADGAEQSDDITILSMQVLDRREKTITLKAAASQLPQVKEEILKLPVDEDMQKKLYLAAEEIFINICSYAYDAPEDVEMKILCEEDFAELTFTDHGRHFDPTDDVQKLEDYDYDHRIGGLGRFITFTIADDYRYRYEDGKNILWLKFVIDNKEKEDGG